tara:strand:- start:621 stop:869 length:249 start_codon:yes stop_codon:yes gene_type:complete
MDLNDTILITKRFRSPTEFSLYIEERVVSDKVGYMDAIINYCNINGVDIENISNLVTESLKQKIRIEAEDANMIKPIGKLPL